jgi:hypothetical protein
MNKTYLVVIMSKYSDGSFLMEEVSCNEILTKKVISKIVLNKKAEIENKKEITDKYGTYTPSFRSVECFFISATEIKKDQGNICLTCDNFHENQKGSILDFEKCEECINLSTLKNNYKKMAKL